MNNFRSLFVVGAGVATLTVVSACSGGQHPSDAHPSSTVEPQTTVGSPAQSDPSQRVAEWQSWLSSTRITDLTSPEKAKVLSGLELDGIVEPAGEAANRFDAVGWKGSCGAALTSVVPAYDNRFDLVLVSANGSYRIENATVDSANEFINDAQQQSACR